MYTSFKSPRSLTSSLRIYPIQSNVLTQQPEVVGLEKLRWYLWPTDCDISNIPAILKLLHRFSAFQILILAALQVTDQDIDLCKHRESILRSAGLLQDGFHAAL